MKLQLVDEAKQWYAMYSIWAFALLGVAPELFNLAVEFGMISGEQAPVILARIIQTVAFFGAASRLIKQKAIELQAQQSQG